MKSDQVRISCHIKDMVKNIVKKNKLYGSERKFIELAVLEKIERMKK